MVAARAVELLDKVVDATNGEVRESQRAMCAEVASSFEDRTHLMVEAPTGVGKSLAYLCAIAAFVERTAPRPRVIVSTSSKALQAQLVNIDVPLLLGATNVNVSFAKLMGRANYICEAKVATFASATGRLFAADAEVDALVDFAHDTATGDRDDAPPASEAAWSKVSISAQECPGASMCPHSDTCWSEAARRHAGEADVVVVNAHLYAADAVSDNMVLGEHTVAVFDEAHALASTFTDALAHSVSPARLYRLAGLTRAAAHNGQPLSDAAAALAAAASPLVGESVTSARTKLHAALSVVHDAATTVSSELAGSAAQTTELAQAKKAVGALVDDVESITSGRDDVAVWVEGTEDHPKVVAAEVDIASWCAQNVFSNVPSVCTSATLRVGGSFEHRTRELGIGFTGEVRNVVVDTPFDYAKQGMLYIAEHLPDPKDRDRFAVESLDELETLVEAANGRTLALFTSWAACRAAAQRLRDTTSFEVLCQGEAPPGVLTEAFREEPRSVLVATSSFWTGVDLRGDVCTLVVIDKLPFPRPDDPLLAARSRAVARAGGNGFAQVALPAAATTLAQGVGRLIRSTDDRGVVAVLDRRLATASYAKLLLDTIPELWRTKDRDRVCAALRRLDEAAGAATEQG